MNDTIGYPDPGLDLSDGFKPHTLHWGVFSARHSEAGLEVRPYAGPALPRCTSPTASLPVLSSYRPARGTTRWIRRKRHRSAFTAMRMCSPATSAPHPSRKGCTGHLTTVEVERFNGNLPPIRAFDPM